MTSAAELFTRLELGASELANVEPRFTDAELMAGPVFFVVLGFSRAPAEKGAAISKPFETWKGFGEVSGRWIQREIAARTHLNKLLMGQAHYHHLAFHDVSKRIDEPGAVMLTPGAEGVFRLVSKVTGEPFPLLASIAIDTKRGKAANQGRAFIYNVVAGAKPLDQVVKKLPELPLSEGSVLMITADSDDAEDGAGLASADVETVTVEGKAEPAPAEKNGKRKR